MLVKSTGSTGANSSPCVSAAATCHPDNTSSGPPHRRPTATAAAATAATASATGVPAGPTGTLSGSIPTASPVNTRRISSARDANRRSQRRVKRRTVSEYPALQRSTVWAPGVRAAFDARRAAGDGHDAALRRVGSKLLGQLHHCLAHREQHAWMADSRQHPA